MNFLDDPNFIQNNFQGLRDGSQVNKYQVAETFRSEHLKKSAPQLLIREEINLSTDLHLKLKLLIEENEKLKNVVEEWRVKMLQIEAERIIILSSKAESEKIIFRLREELQLRNSDGKRARDLEQELLVSKAESEKIIFRLREEIQLRMSDDKRAKYLEQELLVSKAESEKIIFRLREELHLRMSDDKRARDLEQELSFAKSSLEELISKVRFLENQGPKIIEKRIEVPIERIVHLEKPVLDERKLREFEDQVFLLREENRRLAFSLEESRSKVLILEKQKPKIKKTKKKELKLKIVQLLEENSRMLVTLEEWRGKLIDLEENKFHSEKAKKSAGQKNSMLESEIVRLKMETDDLLARGPQIVERIIEKLVPYEVIKEKIVVDDREIFELKQKLTFCNEEIRKLSMMNEDFSKKVYFLENQPPSIIEKRVEVPIEILKERLVVADDKVLREYENSINFQKAENRKLKFVIEELKSRIADLELQISRINIIEKRIEVPFEVVKERIIFDEEKSQEYEIKLNRIAQENTNLRNNLDDLSMKIVKYEEDRAGFENWKKSAVNYENEIFLLKKEIERLLGLLPRSTQLINEKNILSPLEIFKINEFENKLIREEEGDLRKEAEKKSGQPRNYGINSLSYKISREDDGGFRNEATKRSVQHQNYGYNINKGEEKNEQFGNFGINALNYHLNRDEEGIFRKEAEKKSEQHRNFGINASSYNTNGSSTVQQGGEYENYGYNRLLVPEEKEHLYYSTYK